MNRNIAERYTGVYKNGFFGTTGQKELLQFITESNQAVRFIDGNGIKKIDANNHASVGLRLKDALLFRCSTLPFETIFRWSLRSKDEIDFVAEIIAECQINDADRFFARWNSILHSIDTLDRSHLENDVIRLTRPEIMETVAEYRFHDDLEQRNALPGNWWQEFIERGLNNTGVSVIRVNNISYFAPSEEEKRRLAELMEALQTELCIEMAQIEQEMKRRQLETMKRDQEAALEQQWQCSELERQAEREKIRAKAEMEKIELNRQLELNCLEHEKQRLLAEAEIAEILNRPKQQEEIAEAIRLQDARMKEQKDVTEQGFARLSEQLDAITGLMKEKLPITEEILRSMTHLPVGLLNQVTNLSSSEYHAQLLKDCVNASESKIRVRMLRACSCDIGSGKKFTKVETIRFYESLTFEFTLPISGYITVLNIGTSGRFWLHAPNAYVSSSASYGHAGEILRVPGKLLPEEKLRYYDLPYIECGPAGLERIAVLVTPTPLFSKFDLVKTDPEENPMLEILPHAMEQLLKQLAEIAPNQWAAGLIELIAHE